MAVGAAYSGTYSTPRADVAEALVEFDTSGVLFVADAVFPIFETQVQSAKLSRIRREELMKDERDIDRQARSNYARGDGKGEDWSFDCSEYGYEELVDDSERKIYASAFDAEVEAARRAKMKLMIRRERRAAAAAFGANTLSGTAGTDWDTGGDPQADVIAGKESIVSYCGVEPDSLLISYKTMNNLIENTNVRSLMQYTIAPTFDNMKAIIANYLGVQRLVVAGMTYNSADERLTATMSDIWADDFALLYVSPKTQSIAELCFGRTMVWAQDTPGNMVVEQYREEQRRSDVIRVRQYCQEKIVEAYAAYLIRVDAA